jgi:hypothetical protein
MTKKTTSHLSLNAQSTTLEPKSVGGIQQTTFAYFELIRAYPCGPGFMLILHMALTTTAGIRANPLRKIWLNLNFSQLFVFNGVQEGCAVFRIKV